MIRISEILFVICDEIVDLQYLISHFFLSFVVLINEIFDDYTERKDIKFICSKIIMISLLQLCFAAATKLIKK